MDELPDSLDAVVVVDVANVMGARADGWWRDRAGAALRLCREVAALAARGVPPAQLPMPLAAPAASPAESAGTEFVLVLEGRSRDAAARLDAPGPRVRVVIAPGSGDDAIVAETTAIAASGAPCLVVTADRELRRRCAATGAEVTGPSWLLGLL